MFRGYSPPNIIRVTPLKNSVTFSIPANFYSLHTIDLKLYSWLDHDVEQRTLFRGYSPPNIKELCPFENFYKHSFSG